MARTTIVALPDGSVAKRTSKTRVYAWAVMQTIDNRAKATYLLQRADRIAAAATRVRELIASGDLSSLALKATAFNGRGQKFYSSYLPGDEDAGLYWLPDYRTASWAEYIDNSLARMDSNVTAFRAEAGQLQQGPEYSYGIVTWNSRHDLALAACGKKEFNAAPYVTCTPVPCTEA